MGPFGLLEPLTLWTGVGLCALLLLLGLLLVPAQFRRGHAVRGWCTQAVVLVLLPVLVVLTAFVGVNRATLMFTSWSDLVSGGNGGEVTSRSVGSAGAAGAPTTGSPAPGAVAPGATAAGAPSAETSPAAPSPSPSIAPLTARPLENPALVGLQDTTEGQWVTEQIAGPASGVTQSALIHLPPGYLQDPTRQYPVILAFSGIPGAPEAFRDLFQLDRVIDQLHGAGTMGEAIVVAPNVYPGTDDTECVDGADGQERYETWVADDVVGWIRQNLRVIDPAQGGFATFGYSAGGWCASMLSIRHPDLTTVSISMAGYFSPWYAPGQQRRPKGDTEYSLTRIMREQKPSVQMYFFAGGGDTDALNSADSMADAIKESGAPSSLQTESSRSGGHLIYLWVDQTPASLTWLAQHDAAFAPR